jgi:hypothetical protein
MSDVFVMVGTTRVAITPLNDEAERWLLKRLPRQYGRLGAAYEIDRQEWPRLMKKMMRKGLELSRPL